ncbi:hypothetical protein [Actinacidiphila paucisporea]|uniref:Uncharacterized protein n=1 Tax=Actinacidiphila paucisporea TaxID=310782 RepID=A0A1M7PHB7_9ACTN|nr:hypothetical protein [Actinacidiphila paucisporea]SHN16413.1 hypothetical protein SAMN05216499_12387 [Actinacidiphila paucisporea]
MSTRRSLLGSAAAAGAMTYLGPGQAASAAGSRPAARAALVAIDTETQRHYDALRAEVAKRLSPVIVVQNDERGGLYTLVHRGRRESVHPVPEVFELAKSVAHAPLGIYSIIAPHLSRRVPRLPGSARLDQHDVDMVASEGPATKSWTAPLRTFGATLATARQRLGAADTPPELAASSARILDAALSFVDTSVRRGAADMASFEGFTSQVSDAIAVTLTYAARAQISGVEALMTRWRSQVGPADWPGLYVVVLSLWTTSAPNQNSLVVKPFLTPGTADSHLIDLPTAGPPTDPVAVALDNLARIVQDNVAAEMVFPTTRPLADALKGREDLLAPAIRHQLACPYRLRP